MIKKYVFGFCTISVFEDHVLAVIDEGITVSPEHNKFLVGIAQRHFNNKKFVYITHRINSYAVNPSVYLETSQIKNLAGFIVVSNDPLQEHQTKIEKKFFNKPFRKFNDLETAIEWKNDFLHNKE